MPPYKCKGSVTSLRIVLPIVKCILDDSAGSTFPTEGARTHRMKTSEPGAPLIQTNFSFPPVLQGGVLLEDNTLPGMHAHVCVGQFTKSTCPGNQPPDKAASQRTLWTLPMGQHWGCQAVLVGHVPATQGHMCALLLGRNLSVTRSQGTRRSA